MLFRTVCLAATLALAVSAAEDAATERERALLDRIEQLEKRVGELEARAAVTVTQPVAVQTTQTAPPPAEVPAEGRDAPDPPNGAPAGGGPGGGRDGPDRPSGIRSSSGRPGTCRG